MLRACWPGDRNSVIDGYAAKFWGLHPLHHVIHRKERRLQTLSDALTNCSQLQIGAFALCRLCKRRTSSFRLYKGTWKTTCVAHEANVPMLFSTVSSHYVRATYIPIPGLKCAHTQKPRVCAMLDIWVRKSLPPCAPAPGGVLGQLRRVRSHGGRYACHGEGNSHGRRACFPNNCRCLSQECTMLCTWCQLQVTPGGPRHYALRSTRQSHAVAE